MTISWISNSSIHFLVIVATFFKTLTTYRWRSAFPYLFLLFLCSVLITCYFSVTSLLRKIQIVDHLVNVAGVVALPLFEEIAEPSHFQAVMVYQSFQFRPCLFSTYIGRELLKLNGWAIKYQVVWFWFSMFRICHCKWHKWSFEVPLNYSLFENLCLFQSNKKLSSNFSSYRCCRMWIFGAQFIQFILLFLT